MTNKTFETKLQYTNFKAQWKEMFKDARKLERNEYGNKERKFTDSDFYFHAIICGKDPSKGYHDQFRYEEGRSDFEWYTKDRDRFNRRFGKFFTDDGLTLDRALEIASGKTEEAA